MRTAQSAASDRPWAAESAPESSAGSQGTKGGHQEGEQGTKTAGSEGTKEGTKTAGSEPGEGTGCPKREGTGRSPVHDESSATRRVG